MSNVAGRRDGMVKASNGGLCTGEAKKRTEKVKQTRGSRPSTRRSTMYIIKIHGRWRIHIPRI